ncbi:MAG: hypothetical protein KDD11_04705, partial [Acidobacteria bacterium]|nr:hypothetical protein [Acidobacteriota bacterium]
DGSVRDLSDPTCGWGGVTSLEVQVFEMPGDQNTLLREPDVVTLAGQLRRVLDDLDPQEGR